MQPPSHFTAELYADLKAAWADYKDAKKNNDDNRMEDAKQRIRDVQSRLGIKTSEQDFKQAV